MKRITVVLFVAAALLSACGADRPASPGPSGVIAIGEYSGSGMYEVRFVRLDGTLVRRVSLPAGSAHVTAGGDRVFFVDKDELKSVDASGVVSTRARFEKAPAQTIGPDKYVSDLAVSPDGSGWVWSRTDWHSNTSITTTLFRSGEDQQTKVILKETRKPDQRLAPVLWTRAGVVVVDFPIGVGGYIPFADVFWHHARLLDPKSGRLTVLREASDPCLVNDVADSGSYTCLAQQFVEQGKPANGTVKLFLADGASKDVHVDPPAFNAGNAILGRDGKHLALGIVTEQVTETTPPSQAVLYDLDKGTHEIVFEDAAPVAWLPDGSLVCDGYEEEGVSILRPDGTKVDFGAGSFIGYLDAGGSIPSRG